jgi:hypothetical protein
MREQPIELLATVEPGAIKDNYEAVKARVVEALAAYDNMSLENASIKDLKDTRALLNATAKGIQDKRLALERSYMAPFADFKAKVKELSDLIASSSNRINGMIRDVERSRKDAKRAEYQKFYQESCELLAQVVPYERIERSQWYNVQNGDPEAEILDIARKCQSDTAIIKKMGHPCEADVLAYYYRTLDLGKALDEAERLNAERKAAQDLERSIASVQQAEPVNQPSVETTTTVAVSEPAEGAYVAYTLKFTATPDDAQALIAEAKRLGIHGKLSREA